MVNQEEKEYWEFIDKFRHSVFELNNNYAKLSENNKTKVKQYLVSSAETQVQLEILQSIIKRL